MLYHESFPVIGDFCPKPFGQFFVIFSKKYFVLVFGKNDSKKHSKLLNDLSFPSKPLVESIKMNLYMNSRVTHIIFFVSI